MVFRPDVTLCVLKHWQWIVMPIHVSYLGFYTCCEMWIIFLVWRLEPWRSTNKECTLCDHCVFLNILYKMACYFYMPLVARATKLLHCKEHFQGSKCCWPEDTFSKAGVYGYAMSTRYQRYSELTAGVPSMTSSQHTFSKDVRIFF